MRNAIRIFLFMTAGYVGESDYAYGALAIFIGLTALFAHADELEQIERKKQQAEKEAAS